MKKFTDVKFLEDKTILMKIFDYDRHKEGEKGKDIICKCLEDQRCWEPFQTELTTEILNSTGGSFVDVGTHIGYYTILSSLLGKKTYSFDSDYDYLELLRSTIDLNNLKDINIFNDYIDKKYKIPELLNGEDISLLKIDTEGQELEILNKFISFDIPYVIAEISPKTNNTYVELCKKMISLNYKVYNIGLSPQRKLNFNTNHLSTLDKLEIDYDNLETYVQNLEHGQSNFLFVNLDYI